MQVHTRHALKLLQMTWHICRDWRISVDKANLFTSFYRYIPRYWHTIIPIHRILTASDHQQYFAMSIPAYRYKPNADPCTCVEYPGYLNVPVFFGPTVQEGRGGD